MLQVRLAVQIFRLNVAHALVLRTFHHKHVSREKLVFIDLHEVSDLELPPAHTLEPTLAPVEPLRDRIVLLRILAVPAVVLVRVLAHGGEDDEDERRQHRRFAVWNRDDFNRLHDRDKKEVDVGCLGELLEEVYWQERVPVILAGDDDIIFHIIPQCL